MATRMNNSIIGDLRGKVGPLVLSESYGVGTARSMPSKRKKKPLSGEQKMHTGTFGMINNRLRSATDIINLGYQKPKNPRMSAFSTAVSWHMKHALSGDPVNPVLDLEKIKLSCPIKKIQKAWEAGLSFDAAYNVTVAWKLNPFPQKCTQLDDRAVIVIYDDNGKRSRFSSFENAAVRSDLNFTWQLGDRHKGHEVHCYMFMISADKKLVSETQYLGMVSLKY